MAKLGPYQKNEEAFICSVRLKMYSEKLKGMRNDIKTFMTFAGENNDGNWYHDKLLAAL